MFQIGAALLDACVLAVLDECDAYGYILTQNAKQVMNISESTLYPVLRRLQKSGYLTTYDQPYAGRLRRYYAISNEGRQMLEEYRNAWENYRNNVDKILLNKNGGKEDEEV